MKKVAINKQMMTKIKKRSTNGLPTFNEWCFIHGAIIVVGGLLIAIALTLGGHTTPEGLKIPDDSFWKSIENIGSLAFSFMVPILAGYIAVSIADKPGLVPGMIGGNCC